MECPHVQTTQSTLHLSSLILPGIIQYERNLTGLHLEIDLLIKGNQRNRAKPVLESKDHITHQLQFWL